MAAMAKPHLLPILLIPLLLASSSDSARPDDDAELRALLTIKQYWGNPAALSSWKKNSGNTTASASFTYCKWAGVACNNGQVTALSFQNFNIAHPVPSSICNLKNLSHIDLSYNNLTGQFPTMLYHCSALQFLDLSNNMFSGVLPMDINKLSLGMEHLNLSANAFSGSVPLAIASFPKLKSLVLDTNGFSGSYPGSAIGGLKDLETLTLADSPFVPGSIPEEFGKLTKLKMLWMSGMNLTGGIPDTLSSLTELTTLALSDNKLDGEIPEWVWKLQKLEILYLYANRFTGRIGPNITAVKLEQVDLSANLLTGPIPASIGNLKNLTLLYLYFNNISGHIPTSIGLLPNLVDIRLFNNRLSGPLPPELGKHSPLANLEVSDNMLSGELPDTLCYNKELYDIVVFNNNFSGVFPSILGECNMLDNIMVQNNHFTGEFPASVWTTFPKLTTVIMQNNNFTGILPSELSPNITRIEMGNNRFSGAVPESAPGLSMFKAENNWFSHELPADMSKLASLMDLSLAGNQISGSIPASIKALKKLNSLNLSSNQISGVIPAVMGSLPVLSILDLSNNKLNGGIPEDINNLLLVYLNLSSNQLTGEVPTSLQSAAYLGAFLNNSGLCAKQDSGLPLRVCPQAGSHSSSRTVILLVAIIPSICVISLVVVAAGWIIYGRKKDRQEVTSWNMTPFRTLDFTEHDILTGISEENVIGRGGSGKVYHIHLGKNKKPRQGGAGNGNNDEGAGYYSMVAVKKIGNDGKMEANLDKEFDAEVAALGGLRHGNIISLLCCISGNDDSTKLLVYEYMENGSLDRWLHRRRKRGPLDWPTRLSIAIDVARGLSYMHHGFTRPMIHRDVKSSNILLDRGFRAKIADFGLFCMISRGYRSSRSRKLYQDPFTSKSDQGDYTIMSI